MDQVSGSSYQPNSVTLVKSLYPEYQCLNLKNDSNSYFINLLQGSSEVLMKVGPYAGFHFLL